MESQTTIDHLLKLNLSGMVRAYQGVLTMPVQDHPSLNEFIARLVDAEIQERSNRKTELLIRQSKLRYHATIEQIHSSPARNLTKDMIMTLADCSYIDRAENILITGATGCGKSYIACALGRQACSLGYRVQYFGISRLLDKISLSKLDGTYTKLLNQIEKQHLIIIDDFGLYPLDAVTRLTLLQILEDRYAKKSVIISSQLPVAKWYEFIGEPTIADAIMDRLSVNAHRIELKGESLRKKK